MNRWTVFAAFLAAFSCAPPPPALPPPDAPTIAIAATDDAPIESETTAPPEALAGIDVAGLSDRERATWWRAVSELYAPCADQAVSIAACIQESRPCSACRGAATMLVTLVKSGASEAQLTSAYTVRFGRDIQRVDESGSPAKGADDAPVRIVVWHDFECPACREAMPHIERAAESFPGKVRIVHKFYPLKNHPHADPAARAAIAADLQGHYWEMEAILFDRQHALRDADLERYAAELGLDLTRFRADMRSQRAGEIIARDKEAAEYHGLHGTPYILINGRVFDQSLFRPSSDLEAWIATELELIGGAAGSTGAQMVTPSGDSPLDGGGGVTTRRPSTDTSSK
jgi:protein-disulfide isomerase